MAILLRIVVFVVAMLVVASQATAEISAKDDQQLTAVGQKIDKDGTSADSGKVTTKIVDQWKGTQFTFDKGSAPREVSTQDVQAFRQKGLGYGEISILLALGANQDATSAKSLSEILAMRQAGEGWGKLAKTLGYTSLGSVMKSVKASERSIEKVAVSGRAEKADKSDKSGGIDKPGKVEKVEKAEKVERVERPEKPTRAERVERPERAR